VPGGRTAAWADRNALFPSVSNEFPDDQEITRKAHLLNSLDLDSKTCSIGIQIVAEQAGLLHRKPDLVFSFLESLFYDFFKIGVDRIHAGIDGNGKPRQRENVPDREFHLTLFGDLQCIC